MVVVGELNLARCSKRCTIPAAHFLLNMIHWEKTQWDTTIGNTPVGGIKVRAAGLFQLQGAGILLKASAPLDCVSLPPHP